MSGSDSWKHYRAFILRYWPGSTSAKVLTDDQTSGRWRFSLEDPITKTRRGFHNLDALVDFLREQLAASGFENDEEK